ncbi:ZIP family metal transporter [Methylohalobius crimeensis]|uniref:ZIP family metal transporter n=1 Tax=Methylohalobius crimeensis TaxID=244365 RepID=UPI0003B58171|nr:ZIP family metal transporter [Methylohalobius crimeensis]
MSGWTTAFSIALTAFLGAMAAGLAPRYLPAGKPGLWSATTAIAAGLLLASAMVIVIPEGFEVLFLVHPPQTIPHADSFLGLPKVLASGLAILAGFLLMLGLESGGMGHEFSQANNSEANGQNPINMLALGLGLHALTDGLALGASVATGLLAITLPILAAIMVHKIPIAFGLGTFLWQNGKREEHDSLRLLIWFSLATPAGLLITFLFLRHLPHEWIGLILLFSGGTFFYVAAVDVLGRVRRQQQGMRLFRRVGLGAILVIAALILFQLLGFEAEFHS